jgi:regulator of sirC expression with transglutaminase-like and TPR domain
MVADGTASVAAGGRRAAGRVARPGCWGSPTGSDRVNRPSDNGPMASFAELAARPEPRLDELGLALAAEFRTVDADTALATLDELGSEIAEAVAGRGSDAASEARACAAVLGRAHGFAGDREEYDHPDNSMLDRVLERRRGLPILLSVVYVAAAGRAGIPLAGVGLPGHFVVGHFGAEPPVLLDPFAGGPVLTGDVDRSFVRPWAPAEIAMRMLNNLVGSYQRRGHIGAAITAARLRLDLPAEPALRTSLDSELRRLQARLN